MDCLCITCSAVRALALTALGVPDKPWPSCCFVAEQASLFCSDPGDVGPILTSNAYGKSDSRYLVRILFWYVVVLCQQAHDDLYYALEAFHLFFNCASHTSINETHRAADVDRFARFACE